MAAADKTTAKSGKDKDSGANRRQFDRRDTRIAARLEQDGHVFDGVVTNLSLQGCLFSPSVPLKPGSRAKLKLAGESKPVATTIKGVSGLGVHCLLHAGGVTLGRLSADLDDMALLMLHAGRPHDVSAPVPAKPAAKKKTVAKAKNTTVKKTAVKKTAVKKAAVRKTVAKSKTATKTAVKKKTAKKKSR